MEEIKETTVGRLGGIRVGVGNTWERVYRLPDGSECRGLTAEVFVLLEEQNPGVVVGQGSVLTVGDSAWRVVSVTKEPGQLGKVVLIRS